MLSSKNSHNKTFQGIQNIFTGDQMITRKILNLFAAILMLSSSVAIADPYTAIIRCNIGEKHANPMLCLIESEIKVTKNKG